MLLPSILLQQLLQEETEIVEEARHTWHILAWPRRHSADSRTFDRL